MPLARLGRARITPGFPASNIGIEDKCVPDDDTMY